MNSKKTKVLHLGLSGTVRRLSGNLKYNNNTFVELSNTVKN